jgi:hypothetical protein
MYLVNIRVSVGRSEFIGGGHISFVMLIVCSFEYVSVMQNAKPIK